MLMQNRLEENFVLVRSELKVGQGFCLEIGVVQLVMHAMETAQQCHPCITTAHSIALVSSRSLSQRLEKLCQSLQISSALRMRMYIRPNVSLLMVS